MNFNFFNCGVLFKYFAPIRRRGAEPPTKKKLKCIMVIGGKYKVIIKMSSVRLNELLYKEMVGSVLCRLSKGMGCSESELWSILEGVSVEGVSVEKKGLEVEKKRCVESGCVLPWCGVIEESCCRALRLNNGLHTQCNRLKGEKGYCMSCVKLIEKNGGSTPYGSVDDRIKCDILDYVDPKGKATIPFANVMKKLNISKEEALKEAEKLGLTIPECHFEEKKGKRGRPKKDTSAEDTASECSEGEKKKRGRPKKTKEVISNNAGEDLIASLLEQENSQEEKKEEELVEENVDSDEEDETKVIKFEIEGKTYLKSEDNILYDMDSHDAIGIWNDERNEIENIPDEDED